MEKAWFLCRSLRLKKPIFGKFVKLTLDGKMTFELFYKNHQEVLKSILIEELKRNLEKPLSEKAKETKIGFFQEKLKEALAKAHYDGRKESPIAPRWLFLNGWYYLVHDEGRKGKPMSIFYAHESRVLDPDGWRLLGSQTNKIWGWFVHWLKKISNTPMDFKNGYMNLLAYNWNGDKFRMASFGMSFDMYCCGIGTICSDIMCSQACDECDYCDYCKFKKFRKCARSFLWRAYHGAWLEDAKELIVFILLSAKHGQSSLCRLFDKLPREIFMFIFEEAYGRVGGLPEEEREMFPIGFHW